MGRLSSVVTQPILPSPHDAEAGKSRVEGQSLLHREMVSQKINKGCQDGSAST